ncbi:MAG: lamin tail domain-containing protein [Clostridia bacterium]|nr:lamin tail domain-containing protein [Deltaproteobacteria bacterium]
MRFCFWLCVFGLVRCGGLSSSTCGAPGDVVVSELGVRGQSFVELFNASSGTVDLAALVLSLAGSGKARDTKVDGRLEPGSYVSVDVTSLADDGGYVILRCSGTGDVIDTVTYGGTSAQTLALDGSQPPDAASNDATAMWCAQTASPGAANAPCALAGCAAVDARPAIEGDLLITEVMGNPEGADAQAEWVEVYVEADEDIALAGLSFVHERPDGTLRMFELGCDVVAAASYAVLQPADLALYNSASTTLSVLAADGTVIDRVALPSLTADGQVAVRNGVNESLFCLLPEDEATPGAAGTCPAS